MLQVERLTVSYGALTALREVSLSVGEGEIVVLLGGNGAGKSTLFRTLSGLLSPGSGSIRFAGQDVAGLHPHRVVYLGIAQSPEGKHLFRGLSVRKNLLLGAYPHRGDQEGVRRSYDEVLDLFPALRGRQEQVTGSLSGGEQQMVAIGRALMARPRLLLLDEPSLGLAPLVAEQVMDAVVEIRRRGVMTLLAEQNAYAALRIADRGYVLESGSVALSGPRDDLLGNPRVRSAYLGI